MTPFNRKLFYFMLLYTCIEGLVVNVTFPSKLGYIAKDAVLVLSAALLFFNNDGQGFGSLRRLTVPVGLFAAIQVAYLVAPVGEMPLLAKLVGLKMRVLYVVVMVLAYRFVRGPKDVFQLSAVLALAAIPVSAFGIHLYFAGPGALQSLGASYSATVMSTTGVWRVPGTFTSPGQYGLYLTFNSVVTLALLLIPGLTVRMRILLWASLAVMTLAAFASGSRTPLLLTAAAACLVLIGLGRFGRMVTMGMGAYIVFAIGFATLGAGVEERIGSIASMEHIHRFQGTYFGQLFLPKLFETPMGIGLGAATIGARHFSEFREIVLVESYFGLVALETGFLGLLSFMMLTVAAVSFIAQGRLIMRDTPIAPAWYALAAFSLIVLLLSPVSTPLDAAPGNMYFWMSLGIIAKLYDLERSRRAAALQHPAAGAIEYP
jgi:hypothetical protein